MTPMTAEMKAAYAGSNLRWLEDRTIFLTKHGSQAFGTATPTSDTDYKGICIEPPEFYLGMEQKFEQTEFHKPDAVIFSLRKFMKLAADCNPSVVEILFTDPSDWLIAGLKRFDAFHQLLAARGLFLSKKARYTFSGYAMSQLKRIKTHHRWLMKPPDHEPTRAEFGLPEKTLLPYDQLLTAEAAIRQELDSLYNMGGDLQLDDAGNIKLVSGIDQLKVRVANLVGGKDAEHYLVGRQLGYDTNFLRLLELERNHKAARVEWEQYQNWKKTRNPDRAALEAKFGYDTKHAMHLVRLMRMGVEILSDKGVVVKRPDAKELLEIRSGAWSYDTLVGWAADMEKQMEDLYVTSTLPHSPDKKALERLCMDLYLQMNHQ